VTVLARALAWQRTDVIGGEFTVFDDGDGFVARGVAFVATPIAYACRYDLTTDAGWASARLDISAEGAGWQRVLHMERDAGSWRVTTSEQGDLSGVAPTAPLPGTEDPDRLRAAVDVDLYASPLTATLPIRRMNLLRQPDGTTRRTVAAWILLPSLAVLPAERTYTVLGDGRIRCSWVDIMTELTVDPDGFVVTHPGLAAR
jgi:hypothetical protein